jgi:hypothetical protein
LICYLYATPVDLYNFAVNIGSTAKAAETLFCGRKRKRKKKKSEKTSEAIGMANSDKNSRTAIHLHHVASWNPCEQTDDRRCGS